MTSLMSILHYSPERVDLAEALLVGQRGDVVAEALEGVVDALHPLPLTHVGRVPLLDLKRTRSLLS